MRRENAFTIPELLAVVAIIAIILSLLLPQLGKARESARAAICLSNYHAKAVAMIGYATQNRNQFLKGHPSGPYYLDLAIGRELARFGLETNEQSNPAGYYTNYNAPLTSAWLCPNEPRVLLFHRNSTDSLTEFNIYPNFPTTGLKGNPRFFGKNSPSRIGDPRGPIMIESQRLYGGQPRLSFHYNSRHSHAYSDGSAVAQGLEAYPKTNTGGYYFNMNVWGSGDDWYWLWVE
ncbi:MAG: prepilin-type N-terminal cleavage/methylation domain-containing protein [Phycisphaeraceae bacterium]